MKYLYRGQDINDIDDSQTLRAAYRKAIDALEIERRWQRNDREMTQLFRAIEERGHARQPRR